VPKSAEKHQFPSIHGISLECGLIHRGNIDNNNDLSRAVRLGGSFVVRLDTSDQRVLVSSVSVEALGGIWALPWLTSAHASRFSDGHFNGLPAKCDCLTPGLIAFGLRALRETAHGARRFDKARPTRIVWTVDPSSRLLEHDKTFLEAHHFLLLSYWKQTQTILTWSCCFIVWYHERTEVCQTPLRKDRTMLETQKKTARRQQREN